MSDYDDHVIERRGQTAVGYDEGLRSHMLRVYMSAGVGLTGVIAYLVAQNETLMMTIFGTPLAWVVVLSPLAFVFVLSFGINKLSASTARILFFVYAATLGLSLSAIFWMYSMPSIARIFFITMIAFSALSMWGYTTKKDLSGFGTFLFMGLIGIIIASIVNIFMGSSMMEFVISVAGLLIFAGLTAYDNQKIKHMYYEVQGSTEATAKAAVMGSLALYLDFINMFLFLLRLFGSRD